MYVCISMVYVSSMCRCGMSVSALCVCVHMVCVSELCVSVYVHDVCVCVLALVCTAVMS